MCHIFLSATGVKLSTRDAFTIFTIFTSLQFTVLALPHSLRLLGEGKVSIRRLQAFLELPEYSPANVKVDLRDLAIKLEDANLAWHISSKSKEKIKGV